MRTRNSFINFMANTGTQIFNMLLSFVVRIVFIRTLSAEYLGVNGLFANILNVLSLAELGIGTAMIFHMYKPVSDGDDDALRRLMNLYRHMYNTVALVVLTLGLCLVPFLDVLIKDQPDIPYLSLIYVLYLLNTVSSYFIGYKRAIIDAHQKMYIGTVIAALWMTTQFIVQMIILVLFHNFILYVLVQIVCNVMTNVCIAIKAERMYPYLKEDRKALPSKETRVHIYKNISFMSIHKLADVLVNNTDSLIMSAFVGITATGIFSNYSMILASMNTLLGMVFNAFTASIGNLHVEESKERNYHVFKILNFLGFWLFSFSAVAFMVMFNPFIELWAGPDYLFSLDIVFILCLNFFISGMRKVPLTFRDAMGLYWYDRIKPFFEVTFNLTFSLILVQRIGIAGIFVGTIISNLLSCTWMEPYVVYKWGLGAKVRNYYMRYIVYMISIFTTGAVTYFICSFISLGGIIGFIVKGIAVTGIYNGLMILIYHRTMEFQELWQQGKKMILGKVKRND